MHRDGCRRELLPLQLIVTVIGPSDDTPPEIECPEDLVVEATGPDGAIVDYSIPAVTDVIDPSPEVCDRNPALSSRLAIPSSKLQQWMQMATSPNVPSWSVSWIPHRRTSSVSDRVVTTNNPNGRAIHYNVLSVVDIVDTSPALVCTPLTGSIFPVGDTVVNCTAIDDFGIASTCEVCRYGNWSWWRCSTRNRMSGRPRGRSDRSDGAIVDYPTPAASDVEDPSPVVICDPEPGSIFPLGDTIVSCTAIDASGNIDECTFMVSVVDTTPPEIICPDDILQTADGPDGAVVTYITPAVGDIVDPTPEVICDPESGSLFPLGATIVSCTAVDDSGNTAVCTFMVIIGDATGGTPPEIVCPDDIVVECESIDGTVVDYDPPIVTDAEDPNPTVICEPEPGSLFAFGDTIVSCTAVDSDGNIAVCTFVVTVVDTTPPEITGVNDLTASTCEDTAVVDLSGIAVLDNCDPDPKWLLSIITRMERKSRFLLCQPRMKSSRLASAQSKSPQPTVPATPVPNSSPWK